jgi:CRP-like cAMP-binding protein
MKLRDLFDNTQLRKYPQGQIIYYQGDELDSYFYVKSGFIKVYNISKDGDERILMIIGKGDVFPFIIPSKKRSHHLKYFYEATTNVQLLSLRRRIFNEKVKSEGAIARCVLEYTTNTTDHLLSRLDIVESKTASSKVARLLPFLAKRFSKKPKSGFAKMHVKLTHQDIANMTGLTRETTSIHMKKLEKKGVINQNGAGLKVNLKKIKDISD